MVWSWFKSKFRRLLSKEASTSKFDDIKPDVERLLGESFATEEDKRTNNERVVSVFERLQSEIERIKVEANGYPAATISAEVWLDGAGYAELCRKLFEHFRSADWLDREENASALWARATLAVCSHYHHLVGPAMLANADCHERLGNNDHAAAMYRAVIADFRMFLEDDYTEQSLGDEERIAIDALKSAAHRLIEMGGSDDDDKKELEKIRAEANALLG